MSKKAASKGPDPTKGQYTSSPPSSSVSIGKILFVSTIIVALASYYVFKLATTPPEMPKVELEQWWGPYPIDQNPDISIRPYEIEFSNVIVHDLKERLLHRRPFTEPLEGTGFTYGFNTNFLTQVLDYWQNKYNFKDRENFMNKYKHYVTKIQGLDIHYMHVKPKVDKGTQVVTLLMLHGWPGSIREFYEIIPKLTTPQDDRDFVFEVIAPSLPGYGFSQGPNRPGFGPLEIAVVLRNLMRRIGHERYYVQGGDYGHLLGSYMATLFPKEVLGFHTNMPVLVFSRIATVYTFLGSLWPRLIVEPELENRMFPLSEVLSRQLEESGYMHIQATKPDTIGVALTDSPAGLAAYILEKFSTWTNIDFKKAADGKLLDKFLLTHLLDNVMVYWATNTITSSMRLYAETFNKRNLALSMDDIPTEVPTWGIKFKHEILFYPDSLLKMKYVNYLHSTMVEDGGHFAAFENPHVMADDIFKAVETFREFHLRKRRSPNPASSELKQTIYDFKVKDLNGKDVKLEKYKGYVLLIVNVASQCGLTDTNYKQLNEIYDKYASRGLRILAFPCNQFGGQEPGSPEDIFKFTKNRGVKFDILEKVDVNGDNTHPLWQFLKTVRSGTMGDFIKWNFSKFIVDKNGVPVERFGPNVNPVDLEFYLEKYL